MGNFQTSISYGNKIIKYKGDRKMQFKIPTDKFKEMIAKAQKGSSQNRMVPITGLMELKVEDSVLTITTTDAANTLQIIEKGVDGQDGSIVVQVEIISKLIPKLTTPMTEVTLKGEGTSSELIIKANGSYNIEIPMDEEGEFIHFPKPVALEEFEEFEIDNEQLKEIYSINKSALSLTMEQPFLTGYYIGETAISTDTFKVCSTNINLIDKDILIPPECMELLNIVEEKNIKLKYDGRSMYFETPNLKLYSTELEEKDNYPIEAVNQFVDTEFNDSCTVSREEILKTLDRMMLFVSPYDKNAMSMIFGNDSVVFKSKQSNGKEVVKFKEKVENDDYICSIDIELLTSQIAAHQEPEIDIWYGHETALKIKAGKTVQVLALLGDDADV